MLVYVPHIQLDCALWCLWSYFPGALAYLWWQVRFHLQKHNSINIVFLGLYTVMVIVETNQPSADVCKLQLLQAYILCLASGVLFILIGSCWPIAYGWKRRQSRNFTMLGCYSWLLSVLIVSCLAALGLELYEKREALLSSTETTCLLDHDKYQLYQLYIPLVVTSTMGAVVLMFLCSSVCCFCCCSRKIGGIC